MNKLILIIIFFNYSATSLDYKMYCDELFCKDKKSNHTVCLRKDVQCRPIENCKTLPMTRELRQVVVDQHNEMRNRFASGKDVYHNQPNAASNLMVINYDLELEEVVKCHLNTCTFDHDVCRKTKKFSTVGQNTFKGNGLFNPYKINKAMMAWYSEIKNVEPERYIKYTLAKPNAPETGHFTQLVWSKSEFIGCTASTDGTILYFGCNYGPAGNVDGVRTVKWGTPCSECPNKLKCNSKYKSLCGDLLAIPDPPGTKPGASSLSTFAPSLKNCKNKTYFALVLLLYAIIVFI
ncbi:unnamed protein product [Brassicogethes aeneus]|uniref:SCP domain-containing protein n=1 Tax=Brassicogethes aeneus TaxID=1431903 RepID=A0A9P0B9L6_BRAAE|nr:unnamed protein product [Brassicogethes aeneus]